MKLSLEDSWKNQLDNIVKSQKFEILWSTLIEEYKQKCYPKSELIFSALNNCNFYRIKVVIIGQDPYHGENQANGLAFSVTKNTKHPPSLINIFKELKNDLSIKYPENGDLTRWSKQGVLLLNSTLTVRENKPGSHQKIGWEYFTDEIIRIIAKKRKNIVFMLWGNYAKKKRKFIKNDHLILTSGHPSPLSANKGLWFGNNHFSKANMYLKSNIISPIIWD